MIDKDIKVNIADTLFQVRAVAIIIDNDRILFQKRKNDEFWALPGGKVKVGEKSKDTINRELREELELEKFTVKDCNSVAEYFFTYKNCFTHQYIFTHLVDVSNDEWIIKEEKEFLGREKDKDLIFSWFPMDALKDVAIKPDFLIEQLDNIQKEKFHFISYIQK